MKVNFRRPTLAQSFPHIPLLFGLIGALMIAGPGQAADPPPPDSWPLSRGNTLNQGVSAVTLPDQLELLWRFETDRPVKSTPVIDDGRVFIGSDDGNVYALNLATGEPLWTFDTGDAVEAPPIVVRGSIVVGSNSGFVYRLNAENGEEIWRFETQGKVMAPVNFAPQGDDIYLVFGSYDNNLYCVSFDSGEEIWRYATQNYINGGSAIKDNHVIVGGCDALVHIVDIADGSPAAQIELEAYVASTIAVEGDWGYVGHYGNKFVGIDLANHEIAWSYSDRNFPFFSSAAIGPEQVVFGARDRRLHCVDKTTGERLWQFRTRGRIDTSPVLCGDKIVVGSEDGNLYLINLTDGSEIWSYPIGAGIVGSPAVTQDAVVIGSEDGAIYAFAPSTQAKGEDE